MPEAERGQKNTFKIEYYEKVIFFIVDHNGCFFLYIMSTGYVNS